LGLLPIKIIKKGGKFKERIMDIVKIENIKALIIEIRDGKVIIRVSAK